MNIRSFKAYSRRGEGGFVTLWLPLATPLELPNLLTFGMHAHESYCSQFVCLSVCVSITNLAPAYDVRATN